MLHLVVYFVFPYEIILTIKRRNKKVKPDICAGEDDHFAFAMRIVELVKLHLMVYVVILIERV